MTRHVIDRFAPSSKHEDRPFALTTPHATGTPSIRRGYLYVLPCRDDSLLKIGFSLDPLQRFRAFHRRFFEFFDLGRGALIEVDNVRDARRAERLFIRAFAPFGAPSPLLVARSAGCHTAWYRGIHDDALALAHDLAQREGFALHAPLRTWLRERLAERGDLLFDWTQQALDAIESERFNAAASSARDTLIHELRDALDGYVEVGLPLPSLVSNEVFEWYGANAGE